MNQPLNFNWRYLPRYEEAFLDALPKNAKIVDLPHTNVELPLNYFSEERFQIKSTYEKIFSIDEFDEKMRYFLYFEGVMAQADIYVNGVYLGHFISGYLPIEVEFTSVAKASDNRLIVVVDASEDELVPPFGGEIDYLTYGGIYREVKILIRPVVYIQHLLVDGDQNGKINIQPVISNPKQIPFTIEYKLYAKGELIEEFYSNKIAIDRPVLWSPELPYLYELHGHLKTQTGEDLIEVKFGFRTAEFKKDGFYLNGVKRKLIGLNRHQSFPFVGNAASKSLQEYDADKLKYQLGVNVVRSSHYPPSSHFLNRCDELGLMVINEVPGWQYISMEKAWRRQFLDNVERMVITHYNHPSIILNSIRINESGDDHDLYLKANEIAHRIDSSRQTTGVRNFVSSDLLEDVYAYNDFSYAGKGKGLVDPNTVLAKIDQDKPYIVTENNGHMFPTKAFDHESRRVEQAKRHLAVIDSAFANDRIGSMTAWVYADYQTHLTFGSGDHICYHGVLDMFRQPKFAASAYISNLADYPNLHVLSSMDIGEHPEGRLPAIWVMSNCEYIKVYKNNEYINTFYPRRDLYPHLPHPPFIVDEFITDSFNSDGFFKPGDAKKIKATLNYASLHGLSELTTKQKLFVFRMLKKYGLNFNDLSDLWGKHIANWGTGKVAYSFVGYMNDAPIITENIGPSTKFSIVGHRYQSHLHVDRSYDTAIIDLQLLDEYGACATYNFSPFTIVTSDNLALIGPSNTNFIAGGYLVLAKTLTDKPGKAWISVQSPKYGTNTFNFLINTDEEEI